MENIGPNVWINLASRPAVNSLFIHGNAMFVIGHQLGKSPRFFPHCENYQFVDFRTIWMQKLSIRGYPKGNSALNIHLELIIKKLSPMSTSLLLLLL